MQVNLEIMNYPGSGLPGSGLPGSGLPGSGQPGSEAAVRFEHPLLFIHGAFMSASCWERHFLPWFSARGYDCWAFSFRGHGKSSGREFLSLASLDHYRQDLTQAVERLPAPPVLIAHGMGGLVVHRWLHDHAAPGVALLGSMPPAGKLCSMMQLAMTDPQALFHLEQLQQSAQHSALSIEQVRRLLFSPETPDAVIGDSLPLFQAESQRALIDLSVTHFEPLPPGKRPPLLLLGGEKDALLPHHMVHAAAASCGVQGETVPGVGHALMLEPGWESVAQRLDHWLRQL